MGGSPPTTTEPPGEGFGLLLSKRTHPLAAMAGGSTRPARASAPRDSPQTQAPSSGPPAREQQGRLSKGRAGRAGGQAGPAEEGAGVPGLPGAGDRAAGLCWGLGLSPESRGCARLGRGFTSVSVAISRVNGTCVFLRLPVSPSPSCENLECNAGTWC